ncbi:hypothetical protein WA158_007481 [Blastocystis sp. Blastoise]
MSEHEKKSPDILLTVIMLSETCSGKTCMRYRYINGESLDCALAPSGADFKTKYITIDDKLIKYMIWDIPGCDAFRSMNLIYLRITNGIIAVYSIDNRKSFETVEEWIKDAYKNANKNICVTVVGNKCDLESERKVTTQEGKDLAKKYGAHFFETSAKDGTNIDECFTDIVNECVKRHCYTENKQQKKEETKQDDCSII